MAKLKLWMSPGSCSFASHILLHETGVPFETVVIHTKTGFPGEYSHINPKRRVPILEIDQDIITESPAILTAIAQQTPDKNLLGKTNLDLVRTYEWFNWLSGTLHAQAFGGLWRPGRFSDDEATYDGIRVKSRETIKDCFEHIERKLNGRSAIGDAFTAVDAYLLVFYRWGNAIGFDMNKAYPNYTSLAQEVAKRDSVRKATEKEGINALSD